MWEEATPKILKAIELDGDSALYYQTLSFSYLKTENLEKALFGELEAVNKYRKI